MVLLLARGFAADLLAQAEAREAPHAQAPCPCRSWPTVVLGLLDERLLEQAEGRVVLLELALGDLVHDVRGLARGERPARGRSPSPSRARPPAPRPSRRRAPRRARRRRRASPRPWRAPRASRRRPPRRRARPARRPWRRAGGCRPRPAPKRPRASSKRAKRRITMFSLMNAIFSCTAWPTVWPFANGCSSSAATSAGAFCATCRRCLDERLEVGGLGDEVGLAVDLDQHADPAALDGCRCRSRRPRRRGSPSWRRRRGPSCAGSRGPSPCRPWPRPARSCSPSCPRRSPRGAGARSPQ